MESIDIGLYYNGIIVCVDDNNTRADSICIVDETIFAVGKVKEVRSKIASFIDNIEDNYKDNIRMKEIDLCGTCVVPGFIDAHMHPVIAIYFKIQLKLSDVRSYSKLTELLKRENEKKIGGEWIVCFDLLEDNFNDPDERIFPDRYKLDKMCSSRPVFIMRHDGHKCCVNSEALKIMNLDRDSIKNVEIGSGEIQVDINGNPTGIFTEGATYFALKNVSIPSQDRLKEACIAFSDELLSHGITTCGIIIHLTDKFGIAGEMSALEMPIMKYFIDQGDIESDLVFFLVCPRAKKILQTKKRFSTLFGERNRHVVAGVKLWLDGSFGASTAFMNEPFTDSTDGNKGMLVMDKDAIYKIFRDCYKCGLHLACHAIGDVANKIVVDIYEDILATHVPDKSLNIDKNAIRCRIEHASLLDKDTMKRIAKLGIVIVSQPTFIESEHEWIEKRIGPERIKHLYPFRDIIDHGIILAGASDAPIEKLDVLNSIRLCVTRNNFISEQSITPFEALKMFTINAAYSLGQEKVKGSLRKGKLADFVVLNRDITAHPIESLSDLKVLKTYHRGKEVYSSK